MVIAAPTGSFRTERTELVLPSTLPCSFEYQRDARSFRDSFLSHERLSRADQWHTTRVAAAPRHINTGAALATHQSALPAASILSPSTSVHFPRSTIDEMVQLAGSSTTGFPRIGPNRELKFALERCVAWRCHAPSVLNAQVPSVVACSTGELFNRGPACSSAVTSRCT
jgi:hypothetical protein